jgi:glycosyltransferase involved in cell wall biosynthesis
VPLHKRLPAIAMYWFDWLVYRRSVDHLFLPSIDMADVLPTRWPADRRSALPPGCVPIDPPRNPSSGTDGIRILYVGGVKPPVHDPTPLLSAVAAVPDARLIICCPPGDERALARPLPPSVQVVHRAGAELPALYGWADLASIVFAPQSYRRFAMPVKLFEALGYGVPAIGLRGTGASELIDREGIGLATTEAELPGVLRRLARDRASLDALRERARQVRHEHTWRRRAERVMQLLTAEGRDRPDARRSRSSLAPP